MPLNWFRSHRRSSTSSTNASEDEANRTSVTESTNTKHKTKRNKSVTPRSRRSHSHGCPDLRAMVVLGEFMQQELEAAAAVAADEEEQRRISYQAKTRRRFTIHGLSYQHKQSDAERSFNSAPAGSPSSMYASTSPRSLRAQGPSHRRSSRTQQTIPADSHPSIIFIDCPP